MIGHLSLVDRLAVLGIHNPQRFAERGKATVWIAYHRRHALVPWSDRRAVAHVHTDGEWAEKEFRERGHTAADDQRMSVAAAQQWATEQTTPPVEWAHGPFKDSWMPKDVRARVLAELKEAERGIRLAAIAEQLQYPPEITDLAQRIARSESPGMAVAGALRAELLDRITVAVRAAKPRMDEDDLYLLATFVLFDLIENADQS